MHPGTRNENAVDFWRGLALVMIFIDHIPGNVFSYATLRNFAISDAAELFVLLAGWSCSFATGGPLKPESTPRLTFRLLSRAVEIYRAQIVISVIAMAMLAGMAITRSNPLYLEWHNASGAFYDPVRAVVGSVLLTYQLSYFNILPLYVAILVVAPAFVAIGRRSLVAAVVLSVIVYLGAIITHTNLPSWPVANSWYFNPLSWQILFVAGFVAAELAGRKPEVLEQARRAVPYAAFVVAAGLTIRLVEFWPDPLKVPEPRLLFLFDKTYLSPARLLSVFALAIAFHRLFSIVQPHLGPVSSRLCALGRNSLAVFSVASLLSLAGQLIRFAVEGGIVTDIVVILSGLWIMGLTAWFVEWRSRPQSSSRG